MKHTDDFIMCNLENSEVQFCSLLVAKACGVIYILKLETILGVLLADLLCFFC